MSACVPLAWDSETELIRPAHCAPRMVCITWQTPGEEPKLDHWSNALERFLAWLQDPTVLFVGHNVAYDFAVLCEEFPELRELVFKAYDDDRVTCTKLRQQLLDIAGGVFRGKFGHHGKWVERKYDLEFVAKDAAGIRLQKDAWRVLYENFRDVPVNDWVAKAVEVQDKARARLAELEARPHAGKGDGEKALKKEIDGLREMIDSPPETCLIYPKEDARATLAVFQAQEAHADWLMDQFRQARAAFALYLSSCWGARTCLEGVRSLKRIVEKDLAELELWLVEVGLVRKDGSRDTKAAAARMVRICRENDFPIRRTASHCEECYEKYAEAHGLDLVEVDPDDLDCHVCLDSDACKAVEDEILEGYAELSTLKKVLTNDIVMLESGVTYPIHPRYDIAETGRTTCSKPNIQNLRRREGIRECFIPREGYVFAQADFPQLELYCLAQCCKTWLGFSKLADLLNAGLDPHLAVAAQIMGISYEEAASIKKAGKTHERAAELDNARQTAKVANFGFPGGLGIQKLILFAKKTYGVVLTESQAQALKKTWYETFPEMPRYFARINSLMDEETSRANVESLFTKRFRGGATYCAACNSGFQGLGSDCAKNAAWVITRAAYIKDTNPLFNARVVAFVHDEFILEVRDDEHASAAAEELAKLMVEGANVFLPNVPIPLSKMEPLLMRRWSKKAEPLRNGEGKLIPWS